MFSVNSFFLSNGVLLFNRIVDKLIELLVKYDHKLVRVFDTNFIGHHTNLDGVINTVH